MNDTAEEITFENGMCNFCTQAEKSLKETELLKPQLESVIEKIKEDGIGNKYDCLIGVSGGIDSSTVLHNAVKMGLRVLCFTVDNGWNSKLSDENILKIVESLDVPFYRRTIDTSKFNKLQNAFILLGLKNVEIPTDHIIMATSLEIAAEYGIKWILSGGNTVGESIMPPSWGYNARDLEHIKDVYSTVWAEELKDVPTCSIWMWNEYKHTYGINTLYLLDYIDYNVKESKQMLIDTYKWQDYGNKHEESEFTKWFQNYYLPEKFGIDKRLAHYSSLIVSGQMTRDEALEKIKEPMEIPKSDRLNLLSKLSDDIPIGRHEDFIIDTWYEDIAKIIKTKR